MLDIVKYGESILVQKAEGVTDFTHDIEKLVLDMRDTLLANDGVGLAAPQVGISKRIFIVCLENEPMRAFINPRIVATSEDTVEYEEGCLSFPGLYFNVSRPAAVDIEAFDVHGKPFKLSADGFLARVIQHEYDHLDGMLYIDRVSPLKRKRALAHYGRMLKV